MSFHLFTECIHHAGLVIGTGTIGAFEACARFPWLSKGGQFGRCRIGVATTSPICDPESLRKLSEQDCISLRTRVGCDIATVGDPEYDDARRFWNGMIDRKPSAVVRPTSVAEVEIQSGPKGRFWAENTENLEGKVSRVSYFNNRIYSGVFFKFRGL